MMGIATKQKNTLLITYVLFALLFFVFIDFGIRMIYGFSILFLILLFSCWVNKKIFITTTRIVFLFFSMAITFFIFLPNSKNDINNLLYVFSLDLGAIVLLLVNPEEKDILQINKLLITFSFILSIYVIGVFLYPNIYYSFFRNFLSSESKEYADGLLRGGYGIAVGADVTYLEYIFFYGLIICIYKVLNEYHFPLTTFFYFFLAFLFFLCIIIMNRKSELFATLVVVSLLFISRTCAISNRILQKNRVRYFILLFVFVIIISVLLSAGELTRYKVFVEDLYYNLSTPSYKKDISTGRIALWKKALQLFKDNPIIGIGWGKFSLYIPEEINILNNNSLKNVHNNYLQILCETGLLGFLIIIPLYFFLWKQTILNSYKTRNVKSICLYHFSNSISFSFMTYSLILCFIDPCWYKVQYWFFFSISLTYSIFSQKGWE